MGRTDLGAAAGGLTRLGVRRGLVVVVSDFFDPGGAHAVTASLGRLQHRLALVQIVRRTDASPELAGDLEIVDCENGAKRHVTAGEGARSAYAEAYRAFQDRLHTFAMVRNAPLVRIDADEPILPQLDRLFPGGVLRL